MCVKFFDHFRLKIRIDVRVDVQRHLYRAVRYFYVQFFSHLVAVFINRAIRRAE